MTSNEDFLEHFGVKGMKWGVKRGNDASRSTSTTSSKLKKAAVIAGSVAVVAGGAYIAYKMNQSGVKIPVANLTTHASTSVGKTAAEKIVKSPIMNSPIPQKSHASNADMIKFMEQQLSNSRKIQEQAHKARMLDDSLIGNIDAMLSRSKR